MPTRPLARYAAVAAIVLVVGGLFAYREALPRLNGAARLGVLDVSVRPVIGGAAPDFMLAEAGTGRPVRLSDFRGRLVILNFWATWCEPCRAEMPEFQQAYAERGDQDLVILAVNYRESNDQMAYFQKQFGLTFPLVLDRQGDVSVHYGVQGFPATFFIDRSGIVRAQNLGPVVGRLLAEGLSAAERGAHADRVE